MAGGRLQTNARVNEPVANAVLVPVRSAAQKIYVQRVVYSPVNYVAGTVLNVVDSLTGVVIGQITVLPNVSQFPLEFGYNGMPLSLGASLLLSIVSGGVSGQMQVDAYQLPLMVNTPYVAPHTAGFTA